jgi:pimeloyl-ACP methyl ester carboxylesterase
MIPLRFGPSDREMLGMLTSPGTGGGGLAVLFCNPFGQEAVRSKAMYRAFTERLMRQGVHALRFDYHGTGDSPGEGEGQGLKDWVGDTRVAREALLRATGASRLQLFGIGLGATIAAHTALDLNPVPERLALWQPVTDGAAYIELMKTVHRQELARGFGENWPVVRQILHTTEPQAPGVLLGFPLGQRLTEDLVTLGELPLRALAGRGCRIDCAVNPHERVQAVKHENIRWNTPREDLNWMSHDVLRGAIVSPEILSFLFDGMVRNG